MSHSLRRRLLLHLVPAIVLVWLLSAAAASWQAYHAARAALDANLAQAASVVLSLVAHEMQEHKVSAEHQADSSTEWWIGELRSHLSQRAPEYEIADLDIDVDLQKAYGINRELRMTQQM